MNSLVSIITPSYNSSKFIEDCINSVLAQTYTNWEMIIVDDFSEDNSKEKIAVLSENDTRIKTILLDKNIGAAEARNIAISKAKGKYIAFLDSDDIWMPTKLEDQIYFMQEKDIAFSFTNYQPISEDGNKLFSVIKAPNIMTYSSYLKNTIIGCLTVVIDIEKTGNFELPNIRSSHDMALWLLIMKRGFPGYGIDENLAQYRVVSNSNTSIKLRAAKDVWKVYREIEKLSFLFSFWCFLNYIFNAIKKRTFFKKMALQHQRALAESAGLTVDQLQENNDQGEREAILAKKKQDLVEKQYDLVSIITPSYNSEKFINECVSSILNQKYVNWELIIVDDCSKDNSVKIIKSLAKKDNRIKPIFLEENVGAAKARNIALYNAKGKYIAFLDSDDTWMSDKLEKQIAFMHSTDAAFSFTAYQIIDESGKRILNKVKAPYQVTYHSYLKNTIIGCLTVIIDKEKIGSFEMPDIKISEDMALWLSFLKKGYIAYGLNEELSKYRKNANSLSTHKLSAAIYVWKVYREIEKLSFFYSTWCFLNYAFNAFLKRI